MNLSPHVKMRDWKQAHPKCDCSVIFLLTEDRHMTGCFYAGFEGREDTLEKPTSKPLSIADILMELIAQRMSTRNVLEFPFAIVSPDGSPVNILDWAIDEDGEQILVKVNGKY